MPFFEELPDPPLILCFIILHVRDFLITFLFYLIYCLCLVINYIHVCIDKIYYIFLVELLTLMVCFKYLMKSCKLQFILLRLLRTLAYTCNTFYYYFNLKYNNGYLNLLFTFKRQLQINEQNWLTRGVIRISQFNWRTWLTWIPNILVWLADLLVII